MLNWITLIIGASLGASCRYALSLFLSDQTPKFPLATFIANGVGCFLMGIAFVIISERMLVPVSWKPFLMTGFLGAFTTWSSFSVEAVTLLQNSDYRMAAMYLSATVLVCLTGTIAGLYLARILVN